MKKISFTILIFWLTACTSLPPETSHTNITPELRNKYLLQQTELLKLQRYKASGKIGLISPEERISANLNWRQTDITTHLTLTNTLGITMLEAKDLNGAAQITIDGKTHKSDSLEELIWRLTGYVIPTKMLPLWLIGYVDLSKANNLELDANSNLLNFKQNLPEWGEWQVSYNNYYPASANLPALPSKITLKNKDMTIKLLIHKWDN